MGARVAERRSSDTRGCVLPRATFRAHRVQSARGAVVRLRVLRPWLLGVCPLGGKAHRHVVLNVTVVIVNPNIVNIVRVHSYPLLITLSSAPHRRIPIRKGAPTSTPPILHLSSVTAGEEGAPSPASGARARGGCPSHQSPRLELRSSADSSNIQVLMLVSL